MGRNRKSNKTVPDLPPPLTTRKSNQAAHPGLPDKPNPRKSSEVVQAEKAAKAAALAAMEATQQLAIQRAAEIEDELMEQQEAMDRDGNHPPKAKNLPSRAARSKAAQKSASMVQNAKGECSS